MHPAPNPTKLTQSTAVVPQVVLQEAVLDGQAQEVEDALILRSTADVLTDLVPVILVHLQPLQQQQRLLVCPLPRLGRRALVLGVTNYR